MESPNLYFGRRRTRKRVYPDLLYPRDWDILSGVLFLYGVCPGAIPILSGREQIQRCSLGRGGDQRAEKTHEGVIEQWRAVESSGEQWRAAEENREWRRIVEESGGWRREWTMAGTTARYQLPVTRQTALSFKGPQLLQVLRRK
jgi:hypothetical protein